MNLRYLAVPYGAVAVFCAGLAAWVATGQTQISAHLWPVALFPAIAGAVGAGVAAWRWGAGRL